MKEKFELVADGLATRGYAVVDQFLSHSEVEAILASDTFAERSGRFKKAAIGKKEGHQINEAVRGDMIEWIDRHTAPPELRTYLNRLNDLVGFLNQELFLSLKDYEVHMTSYPPGSFYKRHLDQFKHDDHRKLSAICYLNKDWKADHGGQLRMFVDKGSIDLLPEAGRLVCFRSDQIEHEVLPATRERLSLTGWILDQLSDLRHL
jgi:SM-20-related protein